MSIILNSTSKKCWNSVRFNVVTEVWILILPFVRSKGNVTQAKTLDFNVVTGVWTPILPFVPGRLMDNVTQAKTLNLKILSWKNILKYFNLLINIYYDFIFEEILWIFFFEEVKMNYITSTKGSFLAQDVLRSGQQS